MENDGGRYSGAKALIMGLGLHGGGLGAACFLAKRGAELTVTDLRGAEALRPSIEALDDFVKSINGKPVKYVLERHDVQDFENADVVIKNPGVKPDSPYLRAARRVETDISLFLTHNPARLTAVTGSKGKSFTASAIHFTLQEAALEQGHKAFLGGNITVSPLTFLDELTPADDVVLELSSWQLGDLPRGLLKPRAAVITAIMPDHLDRYGAMDAYVADKRVIYQAQDKNDATIAGCDDWGRSFLSETRGRPYCYGCKSPDVGASGAFFDEETGECFAAGPIAGLCAGETARIVPADTLVPGVHQKMNLTAAGLALLDLGVPAKLIDECARRFPGIEHRLEFFYEKDGARFYNDTAATIPEAAAAAVRALKAPVVVTGGTDKNLDFLPLAEALSEARAVVLLAGTGSDKLAALLKARNIAFSGPLDNLDTAAKVALDAARPGGVVVLSPGCASFEMFLNEFDRGRKWKAAVIKNC
ncbi:MAG: UDP-N-acetylmuramoyl-L-alanine--D-glutamate ligase [Spirochaetaceae bacterium]|jgi:UDP-N-acetylmuramoylalanine--D-glutamate ligase|nr:UDP-N-acetylmuramoyl-L-alanine--D-glutamate ligase [Spirochaetaceae bacterium]